MRTGGAVLAPLISYSASGKALAESLRRWWQGFSLPPISGMLMINGMCYNNAKIKLSLRG